MTASPTPLSSISSIKDTDPLGSASADVRKRLAQVVDLVREMSSHTDPNEMVKAYGQRVAKIWRSDGIVSLSRRGLSFPQYRITRFTGWAKQPDPWRERDKLPLMDSGILGELLYSGQPRLVNDFVADPSDPAYEYLKDVRSLNAVPHFDGGEAPNMVVQYLKEPGGFDAEKFPELVWLSNLFGRGVNNMVLGRQLREAYNEIDRELSVVAEIQQSLLPRSHPRIETLDMAAFYQTSKRAGGDYYDFFELPDERWGIFLADVSGHGTPAAVLMAVLHALAHQFPGEPAAPDQVLSFINDQLALRYTDGGTFVTAFYAVYHAKTRELHYASAGHNPPILIRAEGEGLVEYLPGTGLPLGIVAGTEYTDARVTLKPGDRLCFYTDGITETRGVDTAAMFGEDRLTDALRRAHGSPGEALGEILDELTTFSGNQPQADDRTIIVAKAK